MTEQKIKFGERIVNKFIEMIISRLINVQKLQVRVKATWTKLIKGELDGLIIEMYGFLLRKNLRVSEFCFDIGPSAVNLERIKQRKIELLYPAEGTVKMVITQAELTPTIETKLDNFPLTSINCLLENNQLNIKIQWMDEGENLSVNCVTRPKITIDKNSVILEKWEIEGQKLPDEMINIISEEMGEIFSLIDVSNQGTKFQIENIDITSGKLTLNAKSYIDNFPSN
ncbi:MAG TPA: DUF2993 domain-containing protein [Allocoleopsis sp.]